VYATIFGGIFSLPASGLNNKPNKKLFVKEAAIISTLKMETISSSETLLTLNELHCVSSQK
jgi:hypothetical protein